MKIGLIDVDAWSRGRSGFPNLALMKLSAWHKAQGDQVSWYDMSHQTWYDKVYLAKVFGDEYTKDYSGMIAASEIVRGGVRLCDHDQRRQGSL